MDFSNTQLQIDSLPKLDDAALKPISKQYLKIIILNTLIFYLIFYIGLILVNVLSDDLIFQQIFWYLIFGLSVVFTINIVFIVLAFRKRKYAIREHDVIYAKGLLINSVTTVPISRIQHVEESRSWVARQFNLSTLNLYTAGESGSDLSIKGLPAAEAKKINDFISSKVNGK